MFVFYLFACVVTLVHIGFEHLAFEQLANHSTERPTFPDLQETMLAGERWWTLSKSGAAPLFNKSCAMEALVGTNFALFLTCAFPSLHGLQLMLRGKSARCRESTQRRPPSRTEGHTDTHTHTALTLNTVKWNFRWWDCYHLQICQMRLPPAEVCNQTGENLNKPHRTTGDHIIFLQVRGFCVQNPYQWLATVSFLDCHCYKSGSPPV